MNYARHDNPNWATVAFDATIEHVSMRGSDLADDVALFTGGVLYSGGNGAASSGDLLIADFGLYDKLLNVGTGVWMGVNGAQFTFGASKIESEPP